VILNGVVVPPVESAEPTWYLVWDLVGTWIGSIGSAAAAIAAVWLGLSAVRSQREQAGQQARAQAEHVTLVQLWRPDGVVLQVRNDFGRAITAVRVVTQGGQRDEIEHPGSFRDLVDGDSGAEVPFQGVTDKQSVAAVEFDDASGQTWVRTTDSRLVRVFRDRRESCLSVTYRNDLPEVVKDISVRLAPERPLLQLATDGVWYGPPHLSYHRDGRLRHVMTRLRNSYLRRRIARGEGRAADHFRLY
jgi:hypothetical protein